MQIGDKTVFDRYEWRVLDVREDAALLLTDKILGVRAYHDRYVETTWAECEMRHYLNNEFYGQFEESNRAKIVPVMNQNLDNHWYGTRGGVETEDRVFLLSLDEAVCKYFGDSGNLLHNRGEIQYWFQRKDKNNFKRAATCVNGGGWWWWLRSPGRLNVKAVYVWGNGNIGIQGNNILKGNVGDACPLGGVRPALWVKI